MGNCMPRQPAEKTEQNQETEVKTEDLSNENWVESGNKLRIKIVLTKDELDWLVFQLKFKKGKSLEEVLGELERGRGKGSSWKPSLQSITESPEMPEIMDR